MIIHFIPLFIILCAPANFPTLCTSLCTIAFLYSQNSLKTTLSFPFTSLYFKIVSTLLEVYLPYDDGLFVQSVGWSV